MKSFTSFIKYETVENFLESLPKDEEGWAETCSLRDLIQKELKCSMPTTYVIIKGFHQKIEMKHGFVRFRKEPSGPSPESSKSFLEWLADREEVLNNIVAYVTTLPQDPKTMELLIKINSVRTEIQNGVDTNLKEISLILEDQFKIKVEDAVEKGKTLRSAAAQEPKSAVLENPPEETAQSPSPQEEGQDQVVEILQSS